MRNEADSREVLVTCSDFPARASCICTRDPIAKRVASCSSHPLALKSLRRRFYCDTITANMEVDSQLSQLLDSLSLDSQRRKVVFKGKRRGGISDITNLNAKHKRLGHVRLLRQRGLDLSGTHLVAVMVPYAASTDDVSVSAKSKQIAAHIKLQRRRAAATAALRLRVPAGPARAIHAGSYATTGGDYLEAIFTHREAFYAYPPGHRGCAPRASTPHPRQQYMVSATTPAPTPLASHHANTLRSPPPAIGETYASELRPFGIRVLVVAPGRVPHRGRAPPALYLHPHLLIPTLLDSTLHALVPLTLPGLVAAQLGLGAHLAPETHPVQWTSRSSSAASSARSSSSRSRPCAAGCRCRRAGPRARSGRASSSAPRRTTAWSTRSGTSSPRSARTCRSSRTAGIAGGAARPGRARRARTRARARGGRGRRCGCGGGERELVEAYGRGAAVSRAGDARGRERGGVRARAGRQPGRVERGAGRRSTVCSRSASSSKTRGDILFYKNAYGLAATRPVFADNTASDSGIEIVDKDA
ncbi:hypothetical protein NUW54_g695 [Trametes sanguinea]|uniref:Uncharacterized protein n=1 Tax=Trametes sanguinea TaxID=158606 RepID=A0ACC1QB75_9APHY|nr:hypothetical protein NUW54_g695 [Trametes sanguinea]